MKLTAGELISKAEGLKSSEMNVRQRLESIRSQRASVQSAIDTQRYRLQGLYIELEALESSYSGGEDDEGSSDNSAAIAAVMSEIAMTRETIDDYEQEDAELRGEEGQASVELRSIEFQEQETLSDIQDSASRTNQNIALISSFGGDYANVSSQATSSFQYNLSQLSQAAQILGGSVATGSAGYGGTGGKRTAGTHSGASSGSDGSWRNFYEAANSQRKSTSSSLGAMGAKGTSGNVTGRNKQDLYPSTPTEDTPQKKTGGFGKRPTKQTPFQDSGEEKKKGTDETQEDKQELNDSTVDNDVLNSNNDATNEVNTQEYDENGTRELTDDKKQALKDKLGWSDEKFKKCTIDKDGVIHYKTDRCDLEGKTSDNGVPYERRRIVINGVVIEGVFPKFNSAFDTELSPDNLKTKAYAKECNASLKEAIKRDPELRSKFTSEQIKDIEEGRTPTGYVWHHNEEPGKMQLVKRVDHDRTIGGAAHTGGNSLWGADSVDNSKKGESF